MQAVLDYMRLGLGGLFLETHYYREQRDTPDRLKRGFVLVVLIGLLVGSATMVGQILQAFALPSPEAVQRTVYEGVIAMPWYKQFVETMPGFAESFQHNYNFYFQVSQLLGPGNGSISRGVWGGLITPLAYIFRWLFFGAFAHMMARLMGGHGTFDQTLGCTALATGANLIYIAQLLPLTPFTLIAAPLLGLIASYLAIRESHGLMPGRAFWATMLGSVLLGLLFIGGICLLYMTIARATGA